MKISIDTVGRMSFAEVREWLWKCRENEIAHMWQRGAFLATFILGAFTAYAKLLCHWHDKSLTFAALAIGISVVGMILSLLWIAMAKGSSAWYSIYERAISNLVAAYFKDVSDGQEQLLVDVIGTKCPIVAGSVFEDDDKWSNSYWRGVGGKYSLPRINIAIGQLLFLVWVAVLLYHVFRLWGVFYSNQFHALCTYRWVMALVVVGAALLALTVYFSWYSVKFLKSKSLSGYETEVLKQENRGIAHVRAVFRSVKVAQFFAGGAPDILDARADMNRGFNSRKH